MEHTERTGIGVAPPLRRSPWGYTLPLGVLTLCGLGGCNEKLDVGWNDPVEVNITPPQGTMPTGSTVPTESAPTPSPEPDNPPSPEPDDPPSPEPDDPPSPEPETPPSDASTPADAGQETPPATQAPDAALPADDGLPLPVDPSIPIIVNNDGPFDNWQGEYAMLSAMEGRQLLGLIINDSWAWPDLDSNLAGWQDLVEAARTDGIEGIPDPLRSEAARLERPTSGVVEETNPNGSPGAELIVRAALNVEVGGPPLVVVAGGRLTEVADAYLLEPSIADRMIVVASLGALSEEGAKMAVPNGEMDAWADTIVATRLRYIQVSAFYDQQQTLPPMRVPELPDTALGAWIAQKQPRIASDLVACDQVAFLAATTPGFVVNANRVTARELVPYDSGEGPTLVTDEAGSNWLLTEIDGDLATQRFWALLDLTR